MASHNHDNHVHVFSIWMYAKTLFALLLLMGLTIGVSYVNLGSITNNVIAMTIAVIKATLVVLFFMHVKFSSKLAQLWAIAGFVWFTLMTIILFDYGTRKHEPVPSWNKDAGSALPRYIERQDRPAEKESHQPVIRPRY